jgi:hypothetical protein
VLQATRFQIVPMDFEAYLFQKLEKSSARSGSVGGGTERMGAWAGLAVAWLCWGGLGQISSRIGTNRRLGR